MDHTKQSIYEALGISGERHTELLMGIMTAHQRAENNGDFAVSKIMEYFIVDENVTREELALVMFELGTIAALSKQQQKKGGGLFD